MKNAVIYARYSSEKQNEQSIEGQLDICREYARAHDINVIECYTDEALSGKSDKRPGFQKMIRDSKSRHFELVLVYKFDRFARNRFDSAIFKAQLKKNGVRVVSAMEVVAEGPEGIILESLLEGMAEYYSANLAQNVERGMRQRAKKAKFLGGKVPLGFQVDSNKNYIIDGTTAPIVKKIFDMYASGISARKIVDYLNGSGYTSSSGNKFSYTSLHGILSNEKYNGKYTSFKGDIVVENAFPKIVDDVTFEKVKSVMERNKHAPAHAKSPVDFYLSGKLFCGHCGASMVGDSGTGRNGTTHYYYTCLSRKRKRGCKKKSVKKEWIEKFITELVINKVLTDENIEYLAQKTYELYERERDDDSELRALKEQLKNVQKKIDNLVIAAEQGIITPTTKKHLFDAEETKKLLEKSIAKEEIKKPPITKDFLIFFLEDVRDRVVTAEDSTEIIIRTFINSVYLFDDKLTIFFNLRDGNALKKLEIEDIKKFGFNDLRFTITLLSEPLLFVITEKIPH